MPTKKLNYFAQDTKELVDETMKCSGYLIPCVATRTSPAAAVLPKKTSSSEADSDGLFETSSSSASESTMTLRKRNKKVRVYKALPLTIKTNQLPSVRKPRTCRGCGNQKEKCIGAIGGYAGGAKNCQFKCSVCGEGRLLCTCM